MEMASLLSNNFLRFLLYFIMVRFGHDKGPGRISFRSVFLILRWQKEEEERRQKKKFLNFAYMNIGRCSLGICSQGFRQVFACAVIHTAKRRTCLVLRSRAISHHGYNLDENYFLDIYVIQSVCKCVHIFSYYLI